nr:MAG TPA: hypothetical protein [Caudoviricetes sp.]
MFALTKLAKAFWFFSCKYCILFVCLRKIRIWQNFMI